MEHPPHAVPVPVRPAADEAIDPYTASFNWEGVSGATGYELQVAADEGFEQLLIQEEVGEEQAFTAGEALADHPGPYFWRVRAKTEAGWGSFTEPIRFEAASEEVLDAADAAPRPDEQEDLGPAPALFKAAAVEAAAEATGSKALEAEVEHLGVEHEGIGAAQVLGFILAILVVIGMAIVFVFIIVDTTTQQARQEAVALLEYPELRDAEAIADRQIRQYGTASDQDGTYRIPIERAMDILARRTRQQTTRAYSPELQLLPGN